MCGFHNKICMFPVKLTFLGVRPIFNNFHIIIHWTYFDKLRTFASKTVDQHGLTNKLTIFTNKRCILLYTIYAQWYRPGHVSCGFNQMPQIPDLKKMNLIVDKLGDGLKSRWWFQSIFENRSGFFMRQAPFYSDNPRNDVGDKNISGRMVGQGSLLGSIGSSRKKLWWILPCREQCVMYGICKWPSQTTIHCC